MGFEKPFLERKKMLEEKNFENLKEEIKQLVLSVTKAKWKG